MTFFDTRARWGSSSLALFYFFALQGCTCFTWGPTNDTSDGCADSSFGSGQGYGGGPTYSYSEPSGYGDSSSSHGYGSPYDTGSYGSYGYTSHPGGTGGAGGGASTSGTGGGASTGSAGGADGGLP